MKDLTGKIFYALHFADGVAEYKSQNLRVYVSPECAKQMDPTFAGKPLFVQHKDDVTEEDFKEAVGYVVESFFNKNDGYHWAKIIVTKEEGLKAINNGWAVSNAYFREKMGPAGTWHGLEYDEEVLNGTYEHLAIVPDPRYSESKILTPEEYKQYNLRLEEDFLKVANSNSKQENTKKNNKGAKEMKLNFFKREKVENSADLENTMVVLPTMKKTVSVIEAIELADKLMNEADKKAEEDKYANEDAKVKVGDKEMTVNELIEKYEELNSRKNSEDEEKETENEDDEDKEKSMENEEDEKKSENKKGKKRKNKDDEEKAENEDDDDEKKNYNSLKNAEDDSFESGIGGTVDLCIDKTARGLKRYGSGK